MQPKESFSQMRRWSRRHYGLIVVISSIITIAISGYSAIENHIENRIRKEKMGSIERKLEQYEAEVEARTVSNLSLQNDLREIKGYIKGVSDKTLKQVVEQSLLKYEEKKEE